MRFPVIKGVACILAHVPDLVPYGSKPLREIRNAPKLLVEVKRHLRTYEEAVEYPPTKPLSATSSRTTSGTSNNPGIRMCFTRHPALVPMGRSCRRTSSTAC